MQTQLAAERNPGTSRPESQVLKARSPKPVGGDPTLSSPELADPGGDALAADSFSRVARPATVSSRAREIPEWKYCGLNWIWSTHGSIHKPATTCYKKCTNRDHEGVCVWLGGLQLQGLSFSAFPLPCQRAMRFFCSQRSARPLSSPGGRQRTPETQGRVRRHPQSPGAGPVRLRDHFGSKDFGESKFPELGIPEVRPRKARTAMLAEALGPTAPTRC